MKINENQIARVAHLARLELNEDEKSEFSRQLSDIINYVEKINELDTSDVAAADHIVDLKNVLRADVEQTSIDRGDVEKGAPSFENGHFVVPKIIE